MVTKQSKTYTTQHRQLERNTRTIAFLSDRFQTINGQISFIRQRIQSTELTSNTHHENIILQICNDFKSTATRYAE